MDGFEPECWLVHVIPGPFNFVDLAAHDGGRVSPRHPDAKHALRCKHDARGGRVIWLESDSLPPRTARVIVKDVQCAGGTIIHVVDRILYPDG
ncbi:hypothetical protein M885DRAFT_443663 [Pelagophyceae sp. CCMP2097]|nr:hypothetical protein M885DRAFT_443663 [Pelagophyceae sp. CCMP2097]